jgi:hypothetical protein
VVDLWIAVHDVVLSFDCVRDVVDPSPDGFRRTQRPKEGSYGVCIVLQQVGDSLIKRQAKVFEVPIMLSFYVSEDKGVAADVICDRLAECVTQGLTATDPTCNFMALLRGLTDDPCAPIDGLLVYDVKYDGQQGALRYDDRAKGFVVDRRFRFWAATCTDADVGVTAVCP